MATRRRSRRTRREPPPNENLARVFNEFVPDELAGTDRYLDIMTWNIKFFNNRDAQRVELITRILGELNADIFILEEIENESLDGVVEGLIRAGAGLYTAFYGTTGGMQRVALVLDTEWVRTTADVDELFAAENLKLPGTNKFIFPRLPMHAPMIVRAENDPFNFELVGVHMKSQRPDASGDDGSTQRSLGARRLQSWMRQEAADEDVIIAGDWNAVPSKPEWNPFQTMEQNGEVVFRGFNAENEGSFLHTFTRRSRLDLVLVSAEANQVSKDRGATVIPWKDSIMNDNQTVKDVKAKISDHLPVVARFFFEDPTG